MKVIDAGHEYLLDSYDGEQENRLVFMKREGEGYPFNVGHHAGTNCQEVARMLINRVQYVHRQIPHEVNGRIISRLRSDLWDLERRAAMRHGRLEAFDVWRNAYGCQPAIELEPTCRTCGHIQCVQH